MKALYLMLLLMMSAANAFMEEESSTYIINIADSVQTYEHRRNSENLFTFIYQQLNITPEYRYLPSKRGLQTVDEGIFDAEAGRLADAVIDYQNLIKVPAAVATFNTGVFCAEKLQCNINSDIVLVAFEGFKMAKPFCQKLNLTCKQTSNFKSLIKLLEEGLADALFATTMDAAQVICGLGKKSIYYRSLPELDVDAFHFVNRKHIGLVPQLEKAINLAKQTGEVEKSLLFWRRQAKSCGVKVIDL